MGLEEPLKVQLIHSAGGKSSQAEWHWTRLIRQAEGLFSVVLESSVDEDSGTQSHRSLPAKIAGYRN